MPQFNVYNRTSGSLAVPAPVNKVIRGGQRLVVSDVEASAFANTAIYDLLRRGHLAVEAVDGGGVTVATASSVEVAERTEAYRENFLQGDLQDFHVFEDFLPGMDTTNQGTSNWRLYTTNGAGSVHPLPAADTPALNHGRSGILKIEAGPAGAFAALRMCPSAWMTSPGYARLQMRAEVCLPVNNVGTERMLLRCGFSNIDNTGTFTNHAILLYDPATSPFWILQVRLGSGTIANVITTAAPDTSVMCWVRLAINVSPDAKRISAFVDDVLAAEVETPEFTPSLTNRWGPVIWAQKSTGVGSQSVFIDVINVYGRLNTPRRLGLIL